jgi:immunity protein, SdpI family
MKRWLGFVLLLTAAAVGSSLVVYFGLRERLPDPLPTHWNIRGQADGWVPRDRALPVLLLPSGVMALMILLALAIPWLSPRGFDVERFRPTFEYVMFLVVALFGYVHFALLLGYLEQNVDVGRLLAGGFCIFFAFLGNVTGKIRRNFWMGVRTPWTLASEAVWVGTHRQAAWLWTGGALVIAAAVLLGAPLWWCFIALMLILFWPIPYSLILYKRLEKQGKLADS